MRSRTFFSFFSDLQQPQVGQNADLRQFRRPTVPSQVGIWLDLRLPQVGKKFEKLKTTCGCRESGKKAKNVT